MNLIFLTESHSPLQTRFAELPYYHPIAFNLAPSSLPFLIVSVYSPVQMTYTLKVFRNNVWQIVLFVESSLILTKNPNVEISSDNRTIWRTANLLDYTHLEKTPMKS